MILMGTSQVTSDTSDFEVSWLGRDMEARRVDDQRPVGGGLVNGAGKRDQAQLREAVGTFDRMRKDASLFT